MSNPPRPADDALAQRARRIKNSLADLNARIARLSLLLQLPLDTDAQVQLIVKRAHPLFRLHADQQTGTSTGVQHRQVNALEELRKHGLVSDIFGNRITRFAHHLEKVIGIPSQASALLTVLILRGPQTAGELRLNCERLHSFADISSVEAFLEEMAEREENPLVVQLPRAPGSRENRWMHLLCGEPDFDTPTRPTPDAAAGAVIEALTERVNTLEAELAALRSRFERFVAEIGG